MSGFPVLFFDAAYTLIKPRAKLGVIYAQVAQQFGFNSDPEALNAQFAPVFRELRQQRPTTAGRPESESETRQFWSLVIETIFNRAGEPFPPAPFAQELFDAFSTIRCWELYPDALAVLDALRARNYRLGVLSNFDFRLSPLLETLALTPRLDCVVASFQTGVEKPQREAFLHAQRQLPGSRFTMIGDHWEDDVQGALAAGWKALWIDRAGAMSTGEPGLQGQPTSVPRCTTLTEVLDHL